MLGRGKNNILVLVQKFGQQYIEIDRVKFKDEKQLVSNKKHTIPIPPKNPYTFSSGKKNFLFFDIGNKEYVTFEKIDLGLSTIFLDKLFNNEIIGQLAKAVKRATEEKKMNTDIIKSILLYGGLVLIGYLLGVQFGAP